MIDYLFMGGISLLLLSLLSVRAEYIPNGNHHFFDQQNSKAMRGFWSLIVVLVHIPQAYQNPIQDLIGSFAYIGVTFFFTTSAYGLSLSTQKRPSSGAFWLKRLPKLLVPNWITQIISAVILFLICNQKLRVISCITVNIWVQWLLACYIAFWIGNVVHRNQKYSMVIVISLVIAFSGAVYFLKHLGVITATTWCTESIGFIWGIVLCSQYDKIKRFFHEKWITKTIFFCMSSLILGVMYLTFKNVVFLGDYLLKIILGLSILCFVLILNSKITVGNKLSWFLGDISFEIYLIHTMVFTLIDHLLPNIGSGLFIFLSISLSIILAALIHKISNTVLCYCMVFINKHLLR